MPERRASSRADSPGWLAPAWLGAAFVLLGLIVYWPSMHGVFLSDDLHYVAHNEYIRTPSIANALAIWDPTSEVAELVENYAPVHLTLHSLEWQVFGSEVFGYHVVNVLLHALGAALLALLFRRSAIAAIPAAFGAALFFLHPGNVESVAWISQLKSSAALVLSLGALLLHPRRPGAALVFFALALLAKPFAASALVVVAVLAWLRAGSVRAAWASQGGWLLAWLGTVLAFAVAEVLAFSVSAGLAPPLYPDPLVRGLMVFVVALRYAAMAATGSGMSTFHEPLPVTSFADPEFLGGVLLIVLLGWRVIVCLRARNQEAVYWLWAAAGFAPLSGVVPLPYPMADRYLYFVLPGLIGGGLLAGQEMLPRLEAALAGRGRSLGAGLLGFGVVLLGFFAVTTHDRATVFFSAETFMADAERNYPEGAAAHTRKASRAARSGDRQAVLFHLRAAHARGYNRVDHLLQDRSYASMQADPEFMAIKREMAADWISRLGGLDRLSHYKARALAQAYVAVDELEEAARVLESACLRPGPIAEALRADAESLRDELAFRARIEASRARAASPTD